jgi:signal peptidase II
VHSGRETVEVTGDDERDVPVGGDGSTVPGDGAPARDAARAPEAEAGLASSHDTDGAADVDVDEGAAGEDAAADEPDTDTAAGVEDGSTSDDDSAAEPAVKRRRTIPILLAVAALALLLDVISKLIVVATLSDRGPVRLPGGFLYLTLLRNSGAAFSIGESQTWLFTIIAVAVVVAILRVSRRLRSVPWACALGLLLGGALGNLGDRIFRAPGLFRGHVVDFVQFPTFPIVHYDFPVFNLADSAIVVGGCLMVLLSFLGIQPDGTRHQEGKQEEKKDA